MNTYQLRIDEEIVLETDEREVLEIITRQLKDRGIEFYVYE